MNQFHSARQVGLGGSLPPEGSLPSSSAHSPVPLLTKERFSWTRVQVADFNAASATIADIRSNLHRIRESERKGLLQAGLGLTALLVTPHLLLSGMMIDAPVISDSIVVAAALGLALSAVSFLRSKLQWSHFVAGCFRTPRPPSPPLSDDPVLNHELGIVRHSFSKLEQIRASNEAAAHIANAPRAEQLQRGCEFLSALGGAYGSRLFLASGPQLIYQMVLEVLRDESQSELTRYACFSAIITNPPPFRRGSAPAHALAETLLLAPVSLRTKISRGELVVSSWICTQLAESNTPLHENAMERLDGLLRSSSPLSLRQRIQAWLSKRA